MQKDQLGSKLMILVDILQVMLPLVKYIHYPKIANKLVVAQGVVTNRHCG